MVESDERWSCSHRKALIVEKGKFFCPHFPFQTAVKKKKKKAHGNVCSTPSQWDGGASEHTCSGCSYSSTIEEDSAG